MTRLSKYKILGVLFLLVVFLAPGGVKLLHQHEHDFARLYTLTSAPVLADTHKHHCPICEFTLFNNKLAEDIYINFTVTPVFCKIFIPDIQSGSLSAYDFVICLRAPPLISC
jgi:hypothetical protein